MAVQSVVLIAAALIIGIAYNSTNPNGIPILWKNNKSKEKSHFTTGPAMDKEPSPVIKNRTESVTLIRGDSSDKDESAK